MGTAFALWSSALRGIETWHGVRRRTMSNSTRRIGIGYGSAVVSVALVALLRWSLQPALADAAPLILFVLPIVLAGWYGGIGPALLATVLATAAGAYLFIPGTRSVHRIEMGDFARVAVFFFVGICLCIF